MVPAKPDADADAGDGAAAANEPETVRCGALVCTAPAICVASVSSASCRCPIGFIDVYGDGSLCRDINECLIPGICDRDGQCTNTPGSFQCTCAGPALVVAGSLCVCGPGYTRSSTGHCLADDGQACEQDTDCRNNHCEGGTCCAVSCDQPGECQTKDGASCEDGQTCSYPAAPDGTPCDDLLACKMRSVCGDGKCGGGVAVDCDDRNPCTDDSCEEPLGCRNRNNDESCDDQNACTDQDACQSGLCRGKLRSCASLEDSCNHGSCEPNTGECVLTPLADGAACDDDDGCTLGDSCAAGSCSGTANACGPHAIACSTAAGANQCECADGFVDDAAGRCVPSDNECAMQSVCSPDASCEDESNAANDFTCTCKPGFSGDGYSCVARDPCADNPCGADRGTCVSAAAGSYSCTCSAGFVERNGTCACDLSGTFAVRTRVELTWDRMSDLIEPGSDVVYGYAIERYAYDAMGNLLQEHTPCGDGALDLCGVGAAPNLAAEAYARYIPLRVWDLPSMPRVNTTVPMTNAIPGVAFETDPAAHLHGIALADPFGPWPESNRDIAGSPSFDGTTLNGAMWLDHDDDGFIGLTSYVVPPGGSSATGTSSPNPPRTYGASSPVCPRDGGPHTPYAYFPAPAEGPSAPPVRIKRYFTASRVISAYKGTLLSCDRMAGEIVGPDESPLQLEVRVGGCIREHQSGDTACPESAVRYLDEASTTHPADRASFELRRWPSDLAVSCEAARTMSYD